MHLKFTLDVDDWMEFHKHHLLANKQFLKTKAMITYAVPLVFGVFLYYKYQEGTLMMENALMVVFMCAVWVLFYPKRLVSKALTRARESVEKGENSNSLGDNELEISDHEIKHKHPAAETTYEWSGIQHAKETDSSIFLFSSPANPIIIPKKKIGSMEWNELKSILSKNQLLTKG
jgi:hypothetical protein